MRDDVLKRWASRLSGLPAALLGLFFVLAGLAPAMAISAPSLPRLVRAARLLGRRAALAATRARWPRLACRVARFVARPLPARIGGGLPGVSLPLLR
jgi:hypothetical protein